MRYLHLSTINEGKWMIKFVENRFDDPVKNAVWNYVAGYTTGINNILRRRGRADSDYVKLLDSAFTKKSTKPAPTPFASIATTRALYL